MVPRIFRQYNVKGLRVGDTSHTKGNSNDLTLLHCEYNIHIVCVHFISLDMYIFCHRLFIQHASNATRFPSFFTSPRLNKILCYCILILVSCIFAPQPTRTSLKRHTAIHYCGAHEYGSSL